MTNRADLTHFAHVQAGVATLKQLIAAGLSEHHVLAQVTARRWQRCGAHCVVTHNFVPTRLQWMWIAVLDHPAPVALAGTTALQTAGFKFFGQELRLIHIVSERGATPRKIPGVKVHESRRFTAADIDPRASLPRTFLARSSLDAGAWQPHPRYAGGLLAAVVQQRICTAADLESELGSVGRIRHKAHMRLTIQDIAGGAEALSELDIAAMCRKFGLRPPGRQRIRRDRDGRKRYLDCEWFLEDGSIVVLEVDGAHHALVEHWEADKKRERGVVISGRKVLRCTANEARYDQLELVADLEAIGIPRLP